MMANLIGDKSYGDWENAFKDAYQSGGVEAEQAARSSYAQAANAMTPQSSNQSGFNAVNFNGGMSQTPDPYNNPNDPFTTGAQSQPQPQGQISVSNMRYQMPSGGDQQFTGTNGRYAYNPAQDQNGGAGGGALGAAMNGSGMGQLMGGNANPYAYNQSAQGGGSFSASTNPTQAQGGQIDGLNVNPYLQTMGNNLVGDMTSNFQRNVMPNMRSQTMASGGYGGSRQGVVEANSLKDLNTSIGSSLGNLYGQGYNTATQYDLAKTGQANQYDLGKGNLDLGRTSQANQFALGMGNLDLGRTSQANQFALGLGNLGLGYTNANQNYSLGQGNLALGYGNLDRNIQNDNNSWQLQGANFGLGIQDRINNSNAIGLGAGTTIQNTPLDYYDRFANTANSIGQGYGTQTQSGGGGSAITGALGGAQLGNQVGSWWNTGNGSTGSNGRPYDPTDYNFGGSAVD